MLKRLTRAAIEAVTLWTIAVLIAVSYGKPTTNDMMQITALVLIMFIPTVIVLLALRKISEKT